MTKENVDNVTKHIDVFHNLMIDILRRRGLFRAFEKRLVGKAKDDEIYANAFISFYMMDYSRVQLIDLRKFFETDKMSYKISFLVDLVNNLALTEEHKKAFSFFKEKFQDKINKSVVHIDMDSENIIKQISKKDVDTFIDQMNTFLDNLILEISKTGEVILNKELRNLKGSFLSEKQEKEFLQYLKWSCS